MAYPSVTAPYGFKPINRLDFLPYAGATRQFPVTSGEALYYGQLVELVAGGTVEPATSLTSGAKLGVFVGAQYVNSMGQTVQGQYAPASGVSDVIAYVVDDPWALFKVAVTDSAGDISSVNASVVGTNVTALIGTPSAVNGDAGSSILDTSPDTDATFPLRVVAVVPETASGADAFTEVIVKINLHQYLTATGNAYVA
jgi:hypothetical protein